MAAGWIFVGGCRLGDPRAAVPALLLLADAMAVVVELVDGTLAVASRAGILFTLDRRQPAGLIVRIFDHVAFRQNRLKEIAEGVVAIFGDEVVGRHGAFLDEEADAVQGIVNRLGGDAIGIGHRGAPVEGIMTENRRADERLGAGVGHKAAT